jgi:xanthine dehydrogenase small subunit
MRDYLQIFLNGCPLRIGADDAPLTLAEYLRRRRQLTGTKVVCAEGDCGACAVLIGRLSADGKGLEYSSMNSCIQMMFQLDATHVITVEGLSNGELNPIQEAMVRCHGAQCGYCTPGFIVSLCDLMQSSDDISAHDVRRGLVGNLCRCTGYDSIIRAALEADRSKMKRIDELYPPEIMLPVLLAATEEEVLLEQGTFSFFKPVSISSAAEFRAANPGCLIIAGATDIGVQRNKGTRQISVVMSTVGIKSLRSFETSDDSLTVGAGVTLSELEGICRSHLPEFVSFLAFFGSPLIKNAATLAGNLVNASPIGDTIPALFVLDGEIELVSPTATRWININRFYTGYRKTAMSADEIVSRIRIPLPAAGDVFKLYKVSKRKDLDISSFGAAIWMRREGRTIADIRIAYGGVGPMVIRMTRAEEFLRGKTPSLELFEHAGAIAAEETTPISDVRGSDRYRRLLSQNILMKFFHDLGDGGEGNTPKPPAGALGREPSLARSPDGGFP